MTTTTLPKLTVIVHHPNKRAYYAALRLVDRLDPRPQLNTAWRIDGQLCVTLDEAVRALMEAGNAN